MSKDSQKRGQTISDKLLISVKIDVSNCTQMHDEHTSVEEWEVGAHRLVAPCHHPSKLCSNALHKHKLKFRQVLTLESIRHCATLVVRALRSSSVPKSWPQKQNLHLLAAQWLQAEINVSILVPWGASSIHHAKWLRQKNYSKNPDCNWILVDIKLGQCQHKNWDSVTSIKMRTVWKELLQN